LPGSPGYLASSGRRSGSMSGSGSSTTRHICTAYARRVAASAGAAISVPTATSAGTITIMIHTTTGKDRRGE